MCEFELDIVGLVTYHAKRHGLNDDDVSSLLKELDASAKKLRIEPDSLHMVLLDSLSGQKPSTRENILHQIKVLLDNNNTLRCFPVQ